nr:DUF6379 domain-containing protein [uncultured Dorea sp.]
MAGREVFNKDGFKNVEKDGEIIGYEFQFKAQYYRGFTPSILRDIKVNVDGIEAKREDIRFTVNDETFTLEQTRTLVDSDYRWEFGDYATITVLQPGGLKPGKHHMDAFQRIAPSYMPFEIEAACETDFEI